ncbi:hypothetical protein LV164_005740 [Aspergillus fumigatus]|nr:hypothetical protein KXX42_001572 [Aspergillus fumigatus]KAH1547772.1 hypothetical protein KXX57_002289 [Aspergillus fumigatus]KAH1975535.1 hypothetical protein KXW88_009567 [Aspergillus fumigatus]KAH2305811.1 hypothetical protein KXV47_008259 [Aspergillus fumigatus]KAH2661835.1 hypothetical protein KXV32_009584 [Aspergillus fumigatus]
MDGLDFDTAPVEFQKVRWIVETPLIIAGMGWTLNYFFTIRKAYQDRMSGVSLIALSNNLAWEIAFALINPPPNPLARVNYPLWLSVNAFVLYATVKCERESGLHSPFMRRHLPFIVLVSILGLLSGHLAFSSHVGPLAALFWGGMFCQVTLSASALGLLLQRGHTRGMSYKMWLTRFIATGVTVPGLFVRAAYWPEKWDWVNNVLMYWLVGAFYCLDIAYGMCLWYFRRLERMSSRVKQG